MIQDKAVTLHVLGELIKNPYLFMDERFHLTPDDFPERFHKIVFTAIANLALNGAENINVMSIDEYISNYPEHYHLFTTNGGQAYINALINTMADGNFALHYKTLKKYSLLNKLVKAGIDVSEYYNNTSADPSVQKIAREKLDNSSLEDIFAFYEGKLSEIKSEFSNVGGRVGGQAAEGMIELKKSLMERPEMGAPMNSKKLTTICRGRRLKKFYLRTAPSGVGKTRLSLSDACLGAISKYYDPDLKRWVKTKCAEPTLYITTELEPEEVQTMILAYVACVPEEHILDGKYAPGEEKRVDKAIQIVSEAPLWIEHIPQFNVDDIENLACTYKRKHMISHLYFDYIFSSTKILMEIAQKTRGVNIREDNVLVMFSDRMKSLCNRLNIHIDTSTQASGDWKNCKDPDQSLIRGAKGIADKVDIGYVVLEPTEKDLEATKSIMAQAFYKPPNLVYHIYKVRRGKLNHVKLFLYFDYATLRTTDLFVTDRNYKRLDVENTSIETILDETEEEKPVNTDPETFVW